MFWWGIVLFITGVEVLSQHLIGDNICTQEQRYNVTVEKNFKKTVTVREFVWCLGVPPRCSKYRTESKDDFRILEEERTRTVQKCCEGYTEDSRGTVCVPVCSMCVHGECVNPKQCVCNAGYSGIICDLKCSSDKWGKNCQEKCGCKNRGICDPETGSCQCELDWTGSLCEIPTSNISAYKELQVCQECDELEVSQTNEESENITTIGEITSKEFDLSTTQKVEIATHPLMENETNNKLASTEESLDIFNITTYSEMKVNSKGYKDENLDYWPMDEMRSQPQPSKIKVISGISITIGLSVLIILIAIISVLITRYKNRRLVAKQCISSENLKNNNVNDSANKPVIYRSIFHAPLPELPTFQNPVLTSAVEDKLNSVQTVSRPHNFVGLYSNLEESIELQYDYPPSTGSYRAASIPDPDGEPLYDVIPPCRRLIPAPHLLLHETDLNECAISMINTSICNKT